MIPLSTHTLISSPLPRLVLFILRHPLPYSRGGVDGCFKHFYVGSLLAVCLDEKLLEVIRGSTEKKKKTFSSDMLKPYNCITKLND